MVVGPPPEESMCPDLVWVVGEDTAALGEDLIEVIEGFEVLIGKGLVRQWPQAFGGLDFGRIGRQEHQLHPVRDVQVLGDVPAGPVQDQDDVLVRAGPDLGGERCQERIEEGGVDAVGDEPDDLAGRRPDEAVQVEPLEPVVAVGDRAAAARRPDLAPDRLQPEAVFIERPDLDRNGRFRAQQFADAGLQIFF